MYAYKGGKGDVTAWALEYYKDNNIILPLIKKALLGSRAYTLVKGAWIEK